MLNRVEAIFAALAPVLVFGGCFNPKIIDGGFKCSPAGACPDGFRCDYGQGATCVRHTSDGSGGAGGGGAAGYGGSGGGGGSGGEFPCFEPIASCTPTGGRICDPVCQTGCGRCRDKCSVSLGGDLTCNPPTKAKLAGTLERCDITDKETPTQADDCAPGHVCIEDVCFARCFKFCRSDQDCADAFCDRDVGGGQKVCGVPIVDTCTPLGNPGNAGCGGGMACYLSATHSDHTFCDCPLADGTRGADCTRSGDCLPGLTCAYGGSSSGKAQCQQVCDLSKGGTDCGGGTSTCNAYRGATGDQVPNARWGYCE